MESRGIEIYVRPSGDRVLLNLYVPAEAKAAFLKALQDGTLDAADTPIALELSLQPEWATDAELREKIANVHGPIHARIPIDQLNLQFTD